MIYFFKGLFLGFSVFSPFEIVDIIINFLMVYFKKDGKVEDNQNNEKKEEDENDKKNENGENDGTNSLNNNIALF